MFKVIRLHKKMSLLGETKQMCRREPKTAYLCLRRRLSTDLELTHKVYSLIQTRQSLDKKPSGKTPGNLQRNNPIHHNQHYL